MKLDDKWNTVWLIVKEKYGLIIAALAAIVIMLLPAPAPFAFGGQIITLSCHGQQMVALLAVVIIVFITEAMPIGMLIALVYSWIVFLGIAEPKKCASIFSHDAAWFLVGALMIASALTKYNIHKRILVLILKVVGNKVRNIVLGIVTFCSISAAFIADHTIAALMLPIAIGIINTSGGFKKVPKLSKLLLFSIAYGCAIGGLASPSGGGRNVVMIGYIQDMFNVTIGYGRWLVMCMPITLILIPVISFWILRIYKPEITDLSQTVSAIKKEVQIRPMKVKEWTTLVIFLFILFLWVTKSNLGIGMIAMFGGLLFLFFGLTTWKDYQKINWGIGMLYFGAVGFGSVLRSTGAATWLAAKAVSAGSSLFHITDGLPLVGLSTFFTTCFTEIMADGPAMASIGPVLVEMAKLTGTDPVVLGVACACASAFAMCLIIATPPNAIIYGSGYLKAKDFLKAGLGLNIVCLIVLMLVVKFWWGFLGVGINGFH